MGITFVSILRLYQLSSMIDEYDVAARWKRAVGKWRCLPTSIGVDVPERSLVPRCQLKMSKSFFTRVQRAWSGPGTGL